MIIRIVRMTFMAEEVPTFLALFHSHKKDIRAFPGCLHLELHRDADDPYIYSTYSHWRGPEDLENYRHSDLFGRIWPSTKALFAERPIAFSNLREDVVSPESGE